MTTATAPIVRLIGAPTDVGASMRGASMGPEALRVAGIAAAIAGQGLVVEDAGNITGPVNPDIQLAPGMGGYRHLDEAIAWNGLVYDAMSAALSDGRLPVLMGGDHSLAIGSISAVSRHCRAAGRKLRVLWLDAHADCNTAEITPSGNIHGMPVACLFGIGPAPLVGMGGGGVALKADELCQIGIRSVDPDEKALVRRIGHRVYDMRRIDEIGMRAVLEAALADIDEDTHLHLSFDVDFLDPDLAPGVGTAVRGGPGYREAQLCMEMVADSGQLGSMDLVELNPARDIRNTTAELMVELVASAFGKSTLLR